MLLFILGTEKYCPSVPAPWVELANQGLYFLVTTKENNLLRWNSTLSHLHLSFILWIRTEELCFSSIAQFTAVFTKIKQKHFGNPGECASERQTTYTHPHACALMLRKTHWKLGLSLIFPQISWADFTKSAPAAHVWSGICSDYRGLICSWKNKVPFLLPWNSKDFPH